MVVENKDFLDPDYKFLLPDKEIVLMNQDFQVSHYKIYPRPFVAYAISEHTLSYAQKHN
jgi:hypothetical protein